MTVPNEGETAILNVLLKRDLTDRAADLQAGLYTNTSLDLEIATEATVTEPSVGGYARISLTDANWTVTDDEGTFANIDFTASGADITGIQGVFIASQGGTQKIWTILAYTSPPLTIPDGSTFRVRIAATGA